MVSLAQVDRVTSTPGSQLARIHSLEGSAFEVRVPETAAEASLVQHHRRVDDNAVEDAQPPTATEALEAVSVRVLS